MYAGYESTPLECVKDFVNIAVSTGTPFSCFHHHLIYMMEKSLSRSERRYFNVLGSTSGVISFLNEKYMIDFYTEFYSEPLLLCNCFFWLPLKLLLYTKTSVKKVICMHMLLIWLTKLIIITFHLLHMYYRSIQTLIFFF